MSVQPGIAARSAVPRVRVNRERCQGHGRCGTLASELFVLDALGMPRAIDGGVVPPGLEGKAQLARANCPEFAIEIL